MIKASVKTYSVVNGNLLFENVTVYDSEADMEKYCKDQTTQYHRCCGEVLHTWEDGDPEAAQAYFTQLVERHDLTYQYSDDHSAWRRGQQQRDVIDHYANVIGKDVAATIWNNHIDGYFTSDEHRNQFYWKV